MDFSAELALQVPDGYYVDDSFEDLRMNLGI